MEKIGLILAAGQGKRFGQTLKPLSRLYGRSLIERNIVLFKTAGIHTIYIVGGYRHKELEEVLGDGSQFGVCLHYIYNENWIEGNGTSFLRGLQEVPESYLYITMADHVYTASVFIDFIHQSLDMSSFLMAVDKRPGPWHDIGEATKVYVSENRVEAVGKFLKEWTGLDMGLFALGPAVSHELQSQMNSWGASVSELNVIIHRWCQTHPIRPVFYEQPVWMDVDTPEDLEKIRSVLLIHNGKQTDGLVSRYVNRPVSRILTRFCIRFHGCTPNVMSIITFLFGCLSALFVLQDTFHALVPALFIQLASILDGVDGELARLRLQFSTFGAWLDRVFDRLFDGFLLFAFTYRAQAETGLMLSMTAGFLVLTLVFTDSYLSVPVDRIRPSPTSIWLQFRRDVRLLILSVFVLLERYFYGLLVVGVLSFIRIVVKLNILRNHGGIRGHIHG